MHLFDLHCDTLYKAVNGKSSLNCSEYDVQINQSDIFKTKLQCYAVWLSDELSGDDAEKVFFKAAKLIKSECARLNIPLIFPCEKIKDRFYNNTYSAFFTVENALALNGKLENVEKFSQFGVRMMTLTWNAENQIGGGADDETNSGLTKFGKNVIREMERCNMVVDISHACDKLFYDVAQFAKKPFVASHSNSRTITNHRRNLTDEQFKLIVKNKGLVGLNFCKYFLNNDSDKVSIDDILRHTEHFLSLGGEDVLCFGSDFDGCDLPNDISSNENMCQIYEKFLRSNVKESIIRKIFYENAVNFFENFDNLQIM